MKGREGGEVGKNTEVWLLLRSSGFPKVNRSHFSLSQITGLVAQKSQPPSSSGIVIQSGSNWIIPE